MPSRSSQPVRTPPFLLRFLPAVAGVAALAALGLWLYGPTLSLGFAYDDIDHLNLAGEALSGAVPLGRVLLTPHLEHLLPGVVALFLGTVRLFGPTAAPIRWLILAVHLATAWLLGRTARRYGGPIASRVVPFAYLVPCGFSSMWIWQPNGAGVPLAELGFAAALLAIARSEELGPQRARWLAALALAAGLAFEATLAPLVLGPALLDEMERRRRGTAGRPVGIFTVACLALAAGMAVLSSYLYHLTYGGKLDVNLPKGLERAVFLALSAPFRFFLPGVKIGAADGGGPTAIRGCLYGLALALPVAAFLFWLWRRGAPRLAIVALLQAVGPLGLLALVGLGRWRSTFLDLYEADRYFFSLLVPIALLAGAVAVSLAERRRLPLRRRALAWLALAAVAAFWAGAHRAAMLRRIPFDIYALQAERLHRIDRLAARVRAELDRLPPGSGPVRIPDDSFWLPDLHNGRISTRLFVAGFVRDRRFGLGSAIVDDRSAAFLNPILAAWGRETGASEPSLSIRKGRLYDPAIVRGIDFRDGANDEQVISGFYPWAENARWLGARGELRLTIMSSVLNLALVFPRDRLTALDPSWGAATLSVRLVDEQQGDSWQASALQLSKDGLGEYPVNVEGFLGRFGAGRRVRVVLECGRTWRPKDVIPGSTDARELCTQVIAAGF
ncbi:MAG TPA: hypothetical protein VN783_09145 [Thermoanaerobaculia bacterium]|nr:hypothetical protein [Thermoanaerobaculia bacterium]